MANTTFNGPVRSEHGFQSVFKNTTTGVYTPTYIGTKFDFEGMSFAATATGAAITLVADRVHTVNFTGAAVGGFTLPAATAGIKVAFVQSVDTAGGVNAATINCAGTDVWATGTLIESRTGAAVVYDTSTASETALVFTPANAATNLITVGSTLYFVCWEDGTWHVAFDGAKAAAATTGTLLFAA